MRFPTLVLRALETAAYAAVAIVDLHVNGTPFLPVICIGILAYRASSWA